MRIPRVALKIAVSIYLRRFPANSMLQSALEKNPCTPLTLFGSTNLELERLHHQRRLCKHICHLCKGLVELLARTTRIDVNTVVCRLAQRLGFLLGGRARLDGEPDRHERDLTLALVELAEHAGDRHLRPVVLPVRERDDPLLPLLALARALARLALALAPAAQQRRRVLEHADGVEDGVAEGGGVARPAPAELVVVALRALLAEQVEHHLRPVVEP